jgi:hypothetical protein
VRTAEIAAPAPGRLSWLLAQLVPGLDVNVRQDARVDTDFVASIRDHGVLVPVIAGSHR